MEIKEVRVMTREQAVAELAVQKPVEKSLVREVRQDTEH
jgi:hypothetical protein